LRPGGLVLAALQDTALAYLDKRAATDIAFWRMVAVPLASLTGRAEAIVAAVSSTHPSAMAAPMESLPGAGSAPGVTMPSYGVELDGDLLDQLRRHDRPVIARSRDDLTMLDLRSVDPADDTTIIAALNARHPDT
jgi:L-seryl-tRNA(Ser) seleniumtransferase